MAHAKNHDYHILQPSVWPFIGAVSAFVMLFGAVLWMHGSAPYMALIGLVGVLYTMYAWWSDVVTESRVGDHTPVVRIGLRYGVIMFIMSEVMFFAAWFWSFFKHAMYPMETYVGTAYVKPEIIPVDALHLPLINTLLLLLSGCAVTWAHHALVHENNRRDLITGLAVGIGLGVAFTAFQAYEYAHLLAEGWTFSGEIFFANFYMATGFHGFHVIIGTIFLTVCLIRAIKGDFTPDRHVGFEAAAWYWHFVDVVWLFLFFAVYIWGQQGL
jgi:cytochrome c oxidase subunit III